MLLSLLRLNMSMLMVMIFAAVFFFLLITTAAAGAGKTNFRSLALGLVVFLIVGGLLFLFVGTFVIRTVDVQRQMPALESSPIEISHSMPAPPSAPSAVTVQARGTMPTQRHAIGLGGLGVIELIIVASILLFVGAIVSRNRARWSPGMKAGVVLLILAVVALPLGLVLLSHQRVEVVRNHQARQVAVVRASQEEAMWSQAVTEQFKADVYPSREEAVRALARQFDEVAVQVTEDWKNATIYDRGNFPAELVREFRQALWDYHSIRPRWGTWQAPSPMVPHIVLRLQFADVQQKNVNGLYRESGRIVMSLSSEGRAATADVRFVHKPWLADFSRFQAEYPGQVAVFRSTGAGLSEQEARFQALDRAAGQVAALAVTDQTLRQAPAISRGALSVSTSDLHAYGLELDSFSQQLQGSAGPYWRHAVLVDTSPERIRPLAQAKVGLVAARAESWAQLVVKFVGMALLIAAVYFFLNTATRGYYLWSLRIAAVVLLAGGILLVLFLS